MLSCLASCWYVTFKSCSGQAGLGGGLTSYPISESFSLSAAVNYHRRQLVKQFFTFRQMSGVHLSGSRGLHTSLTLNSVGAFESWQTDNKMAVL